MVQQASPLLPALPKRRAQVLQGQYQVQGEDHAGKGDQSAKNGQKPDGDTSHGQDIHIPRGRQEGLERTWRRSTW